MARSGLRHGTEEPFAQRFPVDGVERNANGERSGFDQCSHSEADAQGQHELLELTQEERGHGRRHEVPATSKQGRSPEHDGRNLREQIFVALEGRRLHDDAGEQHSS
jgi:hypothetical protein